MTGWTALTAWWRRNVTGGRDFAGPDPDFGRRPPAEAGAGAPAADGLETQLNDWVEEVDQVGEGIAGALEPPPDPLHIDAGSTVLGFMRGVVQKVLVHAIAYEPKRGQPEASDTTKP